MYDFDAVLDDSVIPIRVVHVEPHLRWAFDDCATCRGIGRGVRLVPNSCAIDRKTKPVRTTECCIGAIPRIVDIEIEADPHALVSWQIHGQVDRVVREATENRASRSGVRCGDIAPPGVWSTNGSLEVFGVDQLVWIRWCSGSYARKADNAGGYPDPRCLPRRRQEHGAVRLLAAAHCPYVLPIGTSTPTVTKWRESFLWGELFAPSAVTCPT